MMGLGQEDGPVVTQGSCDKRAMAAFNVPQTGPSGDMEDGREYASPEVVWWKREMHRVRTTQACYTPDVCLKL